MNPLCAVAVLGLAAALVAPTTMAQPAPAPAPGSQTPAPSTPPPSPPPPPSRSDLPMTSLDVQVVISRYQGQKQISSLPYSLAVTANSGEAQLNMGTDVPVPMTTLTPAARTSQPRPEPGAPQATPSSPPPAPPPPSVPPVPFQSVSYRSVGTAIACRAYGRDNGRYEVTISVDDTSVFTSDQAAPPMPVQGTLPVFRSFKARNTLLLQDGQSRQYTAAADRVSGEVVRVEVTLRVVK